MQDGKPRRTNRARTEATRAALVAAARRLFVDKGYAATGTPDIAAEARVTRGALYHHFADKADLFRAVLEGDAADVAARIEADTAGPASALDALFDGADAYFAAMEVPGRARLLLVEGPSILGNAEMGRIDRATGGAALREGLAHALDGRGFADDDLDTLAELLSAAFDRAALAIAEGRAADPYRAAIRRILKGLIAVPD